MREFVMIGDPVSHVRTPKILNALFREQGVKARISTRRVPDTEVDAAVDEMKADPKFEGLLVTMPHKREIVRFLDRQTEKSRRVGSVNCVKRVPGIGWVGAQFDGVGLARALLKKAIDIKRADILLVGAGGAGAAIGFELVERGCRRLDIHDIDRAASRTLAQRLNSAQMTTVVQHRDGIGGGYSVYINASPKGMEENDGSPIPLEFITPPVAVADITADPADTRLARGSRGCGATVLTGRDMVCGQAQPILEFLISMDIEQ